MHSVPDSCSRFPVPGISNTPSGGRINRVPLYTVLYWHLYALCNYNEMQFEGLQREKERERDLCGYIEAH